MRDPPVITYFSRIAMIVYNSIDQKIDFFDVFQADFFYYDKCQYCVN